MKHVLMGVVLAVAAPVVAQAADTAATTPVTQAPAKFSLDTPIEALAADPQAKAVLDKHFPGLTARPEYEMFKGMSLKMLQPYSQGVITDDMLAKAEADFVAIK